MSENQQEWFVTERARALMIVYLTRRNDLILSEGIKKTGLDYLVRIKKENEQPSVRQFGVFLRASAKIVTLLRLNKSLPLELRSSLHNRNFPYPVCLLYFTMEDDQGYYTWIVEPVVTEADKPQLRRHSDAACSQLDRAALDRIVSQVNAWYDAFFANIVVYA